MVKKETIKLFPFIAKCFTVLSSLILQAKAGKSCGFVSWLVNSDLNDNHSDSNDDDDGIYEDGLKVCECNPPVAEWDSGLFEPEEEYLLPRSSPVISRKRHTRDRKTVWFVFETSNMGTVYLSNCEIELFKCTQTGRVQSSREKP